METVTADRVRIVLGTNPTRLLVYMDDIRIATLGDDEMITFHVSVDQSGIQLIQEIDNLFDVFVGSLSVAATYSDN